MSLEKKVRVFVSYEIPGEERCDLAYSCKIKKCDGYLLQDTCKKYKKYQDKIYQKTAEENKK
jgi:hypothetical protein